MTLEAVHDGPGPIPDRRRGLGSVGQVLALTALCTVLFLTFLDNTIVSVALANIQGVVAAASPPSQWIVNGYMLAFAGLMLTGGTLGDLLGRKRMLLGGVALFCAGSLVAALAPDAHVLIAGRVVMGVGAAACEPGTLSLIRHSTPTSASAHARSGSGPPCRAGPGPRTGTRRGARRAAGWRGIFWFNLAFGAAASLPAAVSLPESSDPEGRRLDVPGLIMPARPP